MSDTIRAGMTIKWLSPKKRVITRKPGWYLLVRQQRISLAIRYDDFPLEERQLSLDTKLDDEQIRYYRIPPRPEDIGRFRAAIVVGAILDQGRDVLCQTTFHFPELNHANTALAGEVCLNYDRSPDGSLPEHKGWQGHVAQGIILDMGLKRIAAI